MKKLLIFFLIVIPLNAIADSDGAFCVGNGYVALETRGLYIYDSNFMSKDVKGTKLYTDAKTSDDRDGVYIIPVGNGLLSSRIFVPADFEQDGNRRISCEDNRVILSDGFEGNIINISFEEKMEAVKAKIEKTTKFSDLQLPFIRKSEAIKIPYSAEDVVMQVPSSNTEDDFFLILDYLEQPHSSGYILHHYAARVVQTGKMGHFVRSTHLADGIRVEAVDPY
ncbi:MAG: hypothetical protein PQ612_03215 [Rickettsiales bacterium]|nr:hypothetical protein [Pseudomonadota bacterium]MDA0965878.1 hypothetical protein [Pseudomonadota bacterium]MDG4542652.1 hypothetical protein [Rickettsiales bacterium]MDG4545156.1 hypothetical protein [Rickettsiales bacterium]MDG4547279.1 hypothetical protein [Rickettsiales bacterium]